MLYMCLAEQPIPSIHVGHNVTNASLPLLSLNQLNQGVLSPVMPLVVEGSVSNSLPKLIVDNSCTLYPTPPIPVASTTE